MGYDQVGCGQSSRPANPRTSAPWLFTIDYYALELRTLVDNLGWSSFHLIGNSFGSIISQAYAFQKDPRLQGLILSGPFSDGQLYIKSQWDPSVGSLGSLPLFVQAAIQSMDAEHEYESALYRAEDQILTSFFTCRSTP